MAVVLINPGNFDGKFDGEFDFTENQGVGWLGNEEFFVGADFNPANGQLILVFYKRSSLETVGWNIAVCGLWPDALSDLREKLGNVIN